MQLNKIADVRSGLVITRKQATKPEDAVCTYQLLNLKAVTDSGGIDHTALLPFHATEQLADRYLTHAGDIIVRISEPYTAVCITEETAGLLVPSHFVIVRTEPGKALPEYVAWYLNRDRIRKKFRLSCAGVLLQIKPSTVAEVEIRLPDLAKQQQIVKLNQLAQTELALLEKQLALKQVYYKKLIETVNRM
jgi:restriction endonuclease S subunit